MEFASLVDEGGFAGVEYGAVGGGEGEGLQFLMEGEKLTDQGFAGGRDVDGNGGFHKTSLCRKEGHPFYLNPAITTREVGYTHDAD